MPEFKINLDNAKNAIAKITFTKEERFNEFIGGLCVKAESFIKLDISTKNYLSDLYDPNCIIIAGDDGGFSQENLSSFITLHESNGYGAGEHGAGMRASYNNYINNYNLDNENNNYTWGIISYNEEIGWKFINIYLNSTNNNFNSCYEIYEPTDEQKELFYRYINNTGTLFLIPNILDDSEMLTCLKNFKKILNYRIYYDDFNFIYKNNNTEDHIILNKPLIPEGDDHDYIRFNVKIARGQTIDEMKGKKSKGLKIFYKFSSNIFNTNINNYYTLDDKGSILEIYSDDNIYVSDIIYDIDFECSNLVSNSLSINHESDYGIKNYAHDVGIWIMRNNIILNMLPFGYNTRGIPDNNICPQILLKEKDKKICQTQINKSKLTITDLDRPVRGLFKYIKSSYYKYIKDQQLNNEPEPDPDPDPEPDPDPVNLTPDPVNLTPDPVNLTPDPVNLTPDPVNLTPDPVNLTPDPSPDPSPVPSEPSDPLTDSTESQTNSYQRFSGSLWKKIFYDQLKPRCIICDKICSSKNPFECCHIKSNHNGGLPEEKNGIMACHYCNRSMGSNNMLEWISNQWGNNSEQYKRVFNYLIENNKYTV